MGYGGFGVAVFFVLSGFVLTWSLPDVSSKRSFYRRRVARIWPANAAVWLVFIVMGLVGITSRPGPAPALAALVLVQSWFPGLGWANAVNGVAWSLSCEFFFYLTFPFLFVALRRLNDRGLALAAVATFGVGAVITVGYLGPRGIILSTFPPFRLYEFVIGIILALGMRRGLVRGAPPVVVSLAILAIALPVSDLYPALKGIGPFAAAVASVLILARLTFHDLAIARGERTRAGWLASSHSQTLGEYSFAFYLVQLIPLTCFDHWFGKPMTWQTQTVWVAAWSVSTVLLAVALHRLVERPAMKALTRQRR